MFRQLSLLGITCTAVYAAYKTFNYLQSASSPAKAQPSDQTAADIGAATNHLQTLDPDTLDETARQQLLDEFTLACEFMNSRHSKTLGLSDQDKLRLYAYYKIGTVGYCNTPKPSLLEFERNAMWNAWKEVSGTGLTQIEAMIMYVEWVYRLDSTWREKVSSKALFNVLGDNSTLTCSQTAEDSDVDDDDDKAFAQSRLKTIADVMQEQHEKATVQREQLKQQRYNELRHRLNHANEPSQQHNDDNDDDNKKISKNEDKSSMGPVFSSSSFDPSESSSTLESTTITLDNDAAAVVAAPTDDEPAAAAASTPSNLSTAHSVHTGGSVLIRVYPGSFGELLDCCDDTLFFDVINEQNRLAIVAHLDAVERSSAAAAAAAATTSDDNTTPTDTAPQLNNNHHQSAVDISAFHVILVDQHRVPLLHQIAESGTPAQLEHIINVLHYPIDLTDSHGDTPLMLAIGNENISLALMLVRLGADCSAQQKDGTTIYDLIDLLEDQDSKQTLLDAIAAAKQ